MTSRKRKFKFESEVHLGLLVIIFILLVLNFASNYAIYRTRSALRSQTTQELINAGLTITRTMQYEGWHELTDDGTDQFRSDFNLSDLAVIPARPEKGSEAELERWIGTAIASLPPSLQEGFARDLVSRDRLKLLRGHDDHYFMAHSLHAPDGERLLLVSSRAPVLASLDDASGDILAVSIVATAVVIGIYLLLLRYIFAPFRIARRQALAAGRPVNEDNDEVPALLDDYEKMIGELQAKEKELLNLNETISRRANSLEQFNEHLLRSIDSGLITFNRQGKVLAVNAAAVRILKLDSADYAGHDFSALLAGFYDLGEDFKRCLDQFRAHPYREYSGRANDKGRLQIGVTISPITDSHDAPVGLTILINDLTEIDRLRRELETGRRLAALGELSGGLAHQLRNSIGAITGFGQLISRRLNKLGLEIDTVSALDKEAHEAELLIEKFLSFVRPLNVELRTTDLTSIIEEVIDGFYTRNQGSRIKIGVEGELSAPIEADPLLLKQALTNLVDNAAQASDPESGKVELLVREGDDWQEVCVRDYGSGIKPDDIDNVFTPFFSSRPSGTGLGLPLAAKIVDLHHGHLSVESEPGKGTEFTIRLPRETRGKRPSCELSEPSKKSLG